MKGKIFKSSEIISILSKQKTQFREVIKPQPFQSNSTYQSLSVIRDCPYQVGQMIFVKESFNIFAGQVTYKQSLANVEKYFWKPATQMKQGQSRLILQIKEIRVERLANISEEDAIAEGIPLSEEFKDRYYTPEGNYAVPKIAFMRWWNSTHKKPEEKFEANPFVWSIQFEVVK